MTTIQADTLLDQIQEMESNYKLDLSAVKKELTEKEMTDEAAMQLVLHDSLNRIAMDQPDYTYAAARILIEELYRKAEKSRGCPPYHNVYELIETLTEKGIYSQALLNTYTREEVLELEGILSPEKDQKFTFVGLFLLSDRYLARDHHKAVYELPQERWLIIAMSLMQNEPADKRINFIKEAYWALSNLYMTVATPTLANAGKSYGQLSSCFIDTVEDSLDGIYLNNWDIARLSKDGGGIGVYFGKVRALGSDIKGFKETSSGVIPWIRLLNDTAVSVDQLGQRQGAVAVYLDIFHKDMMSGFLDLKTNNGDERRKAHDVFTGVTIPDLFMKKLEEKDANGMSTGEWSLFCPHQVKQTMGWKDEEGNALGLEDFYDEKDYAFFTEKYEEAVAHPLLPRKTVRAMDIMKQLMVAQLETGTPYMFYRDEVNRQNPNKKQRGRTSVYCSNLCTEIAQNMSPTSITREYKDKKGNIIIVRKPGDFVVCNLSSMHLANVVEDNVIERTAKIQMRMLDNVIDLNTLSVGQAEATNKHYRAVGLGTFGWHHVLAKQGIYWESKEAVDFADSLYERIAFAAITSSMELSKEKGAYPGFQDSEWENGDYFERRSYESKEWEKLKGNVKKYGIRNGWLMAVAPNSSTAKIAGSTDGIDPIYALEYAEEKKNFKLKVTPPDLTHVTYPFYQKVRHELDQHWSIQQNAARQRHVDQGISFNLYVRHNIHAKDLLSLHMEAWRQGLKTTYYIRSTSQQEIEECESCHS
jgi:ribonucleoside-diphosphate reductase alpha chain